jgi:phosphate starvation-inducible PhoH-like protein
MPIKRPSQKNVKKTKKETKMAVSPMVNQRRYKPQLKARNDKQQQAIDCIEKSDISFLLGPAGTGKTHLAIMYGIIGFMNGKYDKLILTRPVVEAGEHLGFLPGTLEEKIEPYLKPLTDHLHDNFDKAYLDEKIIKKEIEVCPLAYMRGSTFKRACVICDEMQNATDKQLKLLLTRIGEGTKIIITADPDQSDLPKSNDIDLIAEFLSKSESINHIIFNEEDSVRHPLIIEMLKIYKEIDEFKKERRLKRLNNE